MQRMEIMTRGRISQVLSLTKMRLLNVGGGKTDLTLSAVVPVQQGVEHQVELAVILPSVNWIVGEQHDASLAGIAARHVNRERPFPNLVSALHQAAQYGPWPPDVSGEHGGLVGGADGHQRPAEVFDWHDPVGVSIEHRMIEPEHFGIDQRPRSVEIARRRT